MTPGNALFGLFRSQSYRMLDPGNTKTITADRQFGVVPLASAGAETRTLAVPTKAGIFVATEMVTDGGDITLTVTGTYDGINSNMTYDNTSDWVLFMSIEITPGVFRWRVVQYGGAIKIAVTDKKTYGTAPATETAAAQVDGYGIPLTGSRTNALEINADTGSTNLNGDYYVSAVKGNTILGTTSSNASIIGVLGMLNTNTANFGSGDHYAVRGHLDFWGSSTLAGANNNTGALSAYVQNEATTTVSAANVLCGLCVYQVGAPTLASGTYPAGGLNPGIWLRASSLAAAWQTGVYMPVNSVKTAIRVGNWVAAGATGSAIPFAVATQNVYSDGQLDVVAVFGESTSDLTSGYSAKCGRFRHLVSGSSLSVAHETYGLIGQVCVKGTTLTHMHAGLMGTFEGTGASVVVNSAYTYSTAAVIGRIGGGGNITATKALCGFSAIFNGAALASGSAFAYGATGTSTGTWAALLAADKCDAILYVATATNYESGIKALAKKLDGGNTSYCIKISIAGTPAYIPAFAAEWNT